MLKTRRILSLILAMLAIFTSMNFQALSLDKTDSESIQIKEPLLATFDLIQIKPTLVEVTSIINESLEMGEIDYNIKIIDDIITLYDTKGRRYAYYVPILIESIQWGYFVISSINGNKTLMESSLNDNGLYEKLHSVASNETLIYRFPTVFIINGNDSYMLISNESDFLDVTDRIDDFNSDKIINKIMERDIQKQEGAVIEAIPDTYNTSLTNESNFVPVINGNTTEYGGYQQWLHDYGYTTQFWANRSCGVTAAANATYHMAKYKTGKCCLYYTSDISVNTFTSHMNDIYQFMSPAIWGIPNIQTMKNGVEAFAASKEVALTGYLADANWNKENTIAYIRNGLMQNSPVLMVTWNSRIPELGWHWVTLTRIYRNNGGSNMFVTSNWDDRVEYNYDIWFDDYWSLYKGLIYFV